MKKAQKTLIFSAARKIKLHNLTFFRDKPVSYEKRSFIIKTIGAQWLFESRICSQTITNYHVVGTRRLIVDLSQRRKVTLHECFFQFRTSLDLLIYGQVFNDSFTHRVRCFFNDTHFSVCFSPCVHLPLFPPKILSVPYCQKALATIGS